MSHTDSCKMIPNRSPGRESAPVSCWAMERFGAKQMWMYSARNCVSHKCAPPGSESPDSRAWMSAVTESGGWSASTATRMPRSV